jgi:L-asparaginase II
MYNLELDVVATRGGTVESRHAVHAAAVADDGRLVGAARDPGTTTFWRSCAKPFQVMPLLESGGFDEVGWGDDELALACGSHGGEPEHVSLAASMLTDIGLEEGDLACGPHDPLTARGARYVRDAGGRPSRLHNNCSGKHAAMLARAATAGWATTGYEREDHPVQHAVLGTVARWARLDPAAIGRAVDGCGVVVFSLPLVNMAAAYARLARAVVDGDPIARQVVHAMTSRPFLVGGTDRFDSVLMEETEGRVLSKVGAEGVHTVVALDQCVGIAVKAEDGAQRAQFPAVLRALQLVGALPDPLPARLAELIRRPLRNTRGEIVGEVRPAA